VVREAVGETAYAAGEWAEAIAELRTARRMTGDDSGLPMLADAERALGRADRALRLAQSPEAAALNPEARAEMVIVEAGARHDLGQLDAALVTLQDFGLDRTPVQPWSARVWYAYADLLLAAGREDEAREWFAAAAEVDAEGSTDAGERLLELDGVVVVDDDVDADVDADDDVDVDVDGDGDGPGGSDLAGEDGDLPGDDPADEDPADQSSADGDSAGGGGDPVDGDPADAGDDPADGGSVGGEPGGGDLVAVDARSGPSDDAGPTGDDLTDVDREDDVVHAVLGGDAPVGDEPAEARFAAPAAEDPLGPEVSGGSTAMTFSDESRD
jgi:hypothetical protein